MKISVGQVLFIVPLKQVTVMPFLITEEVVRKTVSGTVTTYLGVFGQDKNVVELKSITGKIFHSPEEARTFLFKALTSSISNMIDKAVVKAKEWYPEGIIVTYQDNSELLADESIPYEPITISNSEVNFETNGVVVELPDGTKARLKQ